MRRAAGSLALALLATLVALGVSEGLLRWFAPQHVSWAPIFRRHPALPFFALQPGIEHRIVTGETDWTVATDEQGDRTAASGQRPPGRRPALALGDSFAYGMGVDYEDTFVFLLGERSSRRWWFTNTGVPGYGPEQYRRVLEARLEAGAQPEVVLVSLFLGNDVIDGLLDKDVPVVGGIVGGREDFRAWLKLRSHLYRLVAAAFHRLLPGSRLDRPSTGPEYYQAETWRLPDMLRAMQILETELRTIHDLARGAGAPVFVVLIPTSTSVGGRSGELDRDALDYELPGRRVRSLLDALGLPWVDLTESLSRHPVRETFFTYDGHLTPLGHRIAADAVLPKLERILSASGE
jgi:hypothetical protein